jgi:hypothetical protein
MGQYIEMKRSMDKKQEKISQDRQEIIAHLRILITMSMTMQIIEMMRMKKPMNKLSLDLQENINYNDLKLLFMPEDLLFWAIGMEVMIVTIVEEEGLEIEGANMLNPMKKITLNNIGMMVINVEAVMHEIIQMKRGLAGLNSAFLSLMVDLILKLISHESGWLIRYFVCIIILQKIRWHWQTSNLMTMLYFGGRNCFMIEKMLVNEM